MREVPVFTSDIHLVTCLPWDEIGHSVRIVFGLTVFDGNFKQECAPVTPEVINRFLLGNRIKRLFKHKAYATQI